MRNNFKVPCAVLLVQSLLLAPGCVGIPVGSVNTQSETVSEVVDPDFAACYELEIVEALPSCVKVRLLKTTRICVEVELKDLRNDRYLVVGLFPGFYYEIVLRPSSGNTLAMDYLQCILANAYSVGLTTIFHWIAEPCRQWRASKADGLSLIGFDKTGVLHTVELGRKVSTRMKTSPVANANVSLKIDGSGQVLECKTDAEGCAIFVPAIENILRSDKVAVNVILTATIDSDSSHQICKRLVLKPSPSKSTK